MLNEILTFIRRLQTILYGIRKVGVGSYVRAPLSLSNSKNIVIGDYSHISKYGWLMASADSPSIRIGNSVSIGHFCHIIGLYNINIESKVLIADKVFISDCTHNYEDISQPVIDQGVSKLSDVSIGEGSWIGENVCICGAHIGKHCVIGANSVVTRDIPDYSIAAGIPAKVVKKYDFNKHEWIRL